MCNLCVRISWWVSGKAPFAGPAALDTVPPVLDSEVTRMCAELGNEALGRTAPWDKIDGKVGGLQWWTGCHVSTSGGMEKAVINAAAIGTTALTLLPPPQTRRQSILTVKPCHCWSHANTK